MNNILASILISIVISCKSREHVDNSSLLEAAPIASPRFYTFEAQPSRYHGFSWTNQFISKNGGKAFVEKAVKGAHEKNAKVKGQFRSDMVGGNGLYLAQDPFVSSSYGKVLLALKLKSKSPSVYAHASDADYPTGQERHFIAALLSQNPILHYFWRDGSAFVLRSSELIDQVDVFDLDSVKSTLFNSLPLISELNDQSLPDFIQKFGYWMKAFAAISAENDYRTWKDGAQLSDENVRLLVAYEKTKEPTYSDTEKVTQGEIDGFKASNLAKANAINRAVNLYRQQLNAKWPDVWKETSVSSMINCKKLQAQAEEDLPIYGYRWEDMYSPRIRTISHYSGTVSAEVVHRNADVAFVKTNDNEEGFTYLDDWKCVD
jgi:hypothetical protein